MNKQTPDGTTQVVETWFRLNAIYSVDLNDLYVCLCDVHARNWICMIVLSGLLKFDLFAY